MYDDEPQLAPIKATGNKDALNPRRWSAVDDVGGPGLDVCNEYNTSDRKSQEAAACAVCPQQREGLVHWLLPTMYSKA